MVKRGLIMMHTATQQLVVMVAVLLEVVGLLLITLKRYFVSFLVRASLEVLILMVSSNHQEAKALFTR